MIKVTLLVACALVGVHSGVVPAIPQQYLQYQAGAPALPPHLATQVRALPPPVFRSAAPQPQLYAQQSAQQLQAQQQLQYQPQQQYQAAPQQYAPAPQPQQYSAAPQPRPQAAPARRPAPIAAPGQQPAEEDYDANPAYNFSFDVKDDQFTNYQNRKESREGDKISGSYSVVDSDGFIRTVTYTADPVGGFKAEVIREPTDIKVIVPTPAPVTAGAPQYATRGGQQAYAAQPAPARAAPQQYAPAPQQYAPAPAPQQYAAQPAPVRVAPGNRAYAPQPLQYQG